MGRSLVQPFNQGGQCEWVGVATRLAKVGQSDPMAVSGHGHVLGGDVDEVEGPLLCSFDHGRGRKVVVGLVLAPIGHDGGREQGSRMMGLRWWWPWDSFGQSGSCEMVAGGGDEMVVDDGVVDGLVVNGASLSPSAGEGSSRVIKGGGRW